MEKHKLASQVYRARRDPITGKPIEEDPDFQKELAEEKARQFFGVKPKPPKRSEAAPNIIDSYRVLLGLDHATVAAIFDREIGAKEVLVDELVLMDHSVVEQQARDLQTEIDALKKLIESRSVHMQKLHRPDDILPRNDRERLKREERAELNKKEAELRVLKGRLFHWAKDPRNYEPSYKTKTVSLRFGDEYPVTHVEKTIEHGWHRAFDVNKRGNVTEFDLCGALEMPVGGEYDIEGYRKLIELGEEALEQMSGDKDWAGWKQWENKVILQAISCGLIRPPEDLIAIHPSLGKWVPPDDPDDDDHEHERDLILKTGSGLGVGTQVYSRGWRVGKHGNRLRPLESFNATIALGGAGNRNGEPDSYAPEIDDDAESHMPD